MVFSSTQIERFWTHELEKFQHTGAGHLRAPCPVHQGDATDTLSVDLRTGYAYCFKCHNGNQGWSMLEFTMARYGLTRQCALDHVRYIVGDISRPTIAPWRFPFPKPLAVTDSEWQLGHLARRIMQYIEYLDQQGEPGWEAYALYVYETIESVKVRVRHKLTGEKRMLWLALTAKGGWSKPSKLDRQAPLYRAHSLAGQKVVWVLNGEKAVDRAIEAWPDIAATCLPNGEGHWKDNYLAPLKEAEEIYLVLDNDESGEKHGAVVGPMLARAGMKTHLVRLPGLPEKGDMWDFIEAGGTLEEALAIAREAPLASATAAPAESKSKVRQMPRRDSSGGRGGGDSGPPIEGPDIVDYDNNDRGNAARLVAFAAGHLHYARQLEDSWLHFENTHWKAGAIELAYEPAGQTLALLKQQANTRSDDRLWKFAHQRQNAGGIRSMIELAKKDLTVDVDKLDSRPRLINCLNGTFDLDAGILREHRASDYLTHIFRFNYNPTLPDPELFLRTLSEWFGGNADASEGTLDLVERIINYLQGLFGYLLSGDVGLKIFCIFYGPGNNGKSTLINLLLEILGEYGVTISPATLVHGFGRNENNTNADIARTRGARAAFAAEPPEGQKFNQALIKLLSQGAVPITGVFKAKQPFAFIPTAKLMLETNYIPTFENTEDRAFFDRMHLVPFLVRFPGGERAGQTRGDQLRAEYPQIFNWMIKGALRTMRDGLQPPAELRLGLSEIRNIQARDDGLEPFLEECFNFGPDLHCTVAEVQTLHQQYCERYKGRPLPRNRLSRMLTERSNITRGNDPKDHKTPAWLRGLAPKNRAATWGGRDLQTKEPDDDD